MLLVVLSVPGYLGFKSTAESFYVQKVCQPKQSFVCFGTVSLRRLTDVETQYWLELFFFFNNKKKRVKELRSSEFRWRTMWDL